MMKTRIEQVAKHHFPWSSRDVKYALESVSGLTGSMLERALDEWTDGLHAHGWAYPQAVQFTSDMRRVLGGRSHRGPLED